MVAMAENSTVPSLTNLQVEHADWLYFCPWYNTEQDPFVIGEAYQDLDELKKVYLSDFCITLDELPEDLFKTTVKPVSGTTTTTTGKESGKADLLGDVNLDKAVDVEDAVLLARYLAEDGDAVIDAQGKLNADMNASGAPDTDDTGLILRKIAKLD
jgi:hypothetical protein